MEPLISIIIPVYNAESFLSQCIESVLKQTYHNIEIIVVNDGSTDNSLSICKDFEKKDARLLVIDKENGGVSIARNTGLDYANGEFILFVDSDDWMEMDACERLLNAQQKNDSDLTVADIIHETDTGSFHVRIFNREFDVDDSQFCLQYQMTCIGYGYNPYPTNQGTVSGIGSVWNKMFRKRIIQDHHLRFDPGTFDIYEDNLFTMNYLDYCNRVSYISIPIYHYRMVDGSSIHKYRSNSCEISRRIFEKVEQFIAGKKDSESFLPAYYVLVIRRLSEMLRVYFFHPNAGKRSVKRKELHALIHQEPYRNAIKNVDMNRLMTAHRFTCLCAKTGSAWVLYFGYLVRETVKKLRA